MSQYDIGIVGGGLAGLASACLLAKNGYSVVIFQENYFPFHHISGEYISKESSMFLANLDLDIKALGAIELKQFKINHFLGAELQIPLPESGFGLSRYALDDKIADIALANGAILLQGTRVENIAYLAEKDNFTLTVPSGNFTCKTLIAGFDQNTAFDKMLKWSSTKTQEDLKYHLIGIKYHVKTEIPSNQIELYVQEHGYLIINQVEGGKNCFCYLSTSSQMQNTAESIEVLMQEMFAQHKTLAKNHAHFAESFGKPLCISPIAFGTRELVDKHILMATDFQEGFTPITGSGMNVALHSAKILAENIGDFLLKKIDRKSLEGNYAKQWQQHFGKTIKKARRKQHLLIQAKRANRAINTMKYFPFLAKNIIRSFQGKPF